MVATGIAARRDSGEAHDTGHCTATEATYPMTYL